MVASEDYCFYKKRMEIYDTNPNVSLHWIRVNTINSCYK